MDPDLEFQGRLSDNGAIAVTAAAALILVVIIGIGLLPEASEDPRGGVTGDAASTTPPAAATLRPTPSPLPGPAEPDWSPRHPYEIEPGAYYLAWESLRVRLTMPPWWSTTDRGATLANVAGTATVSLSGKPYDIRVATDVCPLGDGTTFARTGPLASALVHELLNQVGVAGPAPVEVTVGTFPATKIVRTEILCRGPGPEGRSLWQEGEAMQCPARRERPCATGPEAFGLLFGGTATIYVVDVNGKRLVIAMQERGASLEDLAELDAIVASIEIEPAAVPIWAASGDSAVGRQPLAVDGLPISFSVHLPGWEFHDGHSFTKSLPADEQGAEAIVYWTTFPDSRSADLCYEVLGDPSGETGADALADAVAEASGTDLVDGPDDASVGGRSAKYVVVRVREDAPWCDPGFFSTWPYVRGGAFWAHTAVGDTIRVWIVDLDGTRVIIAGETRLRSGLGVDLTESQIADLDREIHEIVGSITFD